MKKTTLADVLKVIEKWAKDNNDLVEFHGAFWSFKDDKDYEFKEDVKLAFGLKENLQTSMEEMSKDLEAEKEEFISW